MARVRLEALVYVLCLLMLQGSPLEHGFCFPVAELGEILCCYAILYCVSLWHPRFALSILVGHQFLFGVCSCLLIIAVANNRISCGGKVSRDRDILRGNLSSLCVVLAGWDGACLPYYGLRGLLHVRVLKLRRVPATFDPRRCLLSRAVNVGDQQVICSNFAWHGPIGRVSNLSVAGLSLFRDGWVGSNDDRIVLLILLEGVLVIYESISWVKFTVVLIQSLLAGQRLDAAV